MYFKKFFDDKYLVIIYKSGKYFKSLLSKWWLVMITLQIFAPPTLAAYPVQWQVGFQSPATANMQEIIELYNFVLLVLVFIFLVVIGLLIYICIRFNHRTNPIPAHFSSNIKLEIIWIIIPCLLIALISIPSFRLLAKVYPVPQAEFTVKVTGYQWYWHYAYPEHGNINYDSFLIKDEDLQAGQLRLLEVDKRLIVPVNTVVRFLVTAADVIHSFAIPSAGIKIDAVPGRVNETWVKFLKKGVYYGQCSELCGIDHAFMPIAVEVVSQEEFAAWVAYEIYKVKSN